MRKLKDNLPKLF